ncbi:MAG: hypothetical protein GMKNLPBB_03404 [Myxococcota bacterium]|nr:hypothetical protein [Myxococcota bacterium]
MKTPFRAFIAREFINDTVHQLCYGAMKVNYLGVPREKDNSMAMMQRLFLIVGVAAWVAACGQTAPDMGNARPLNRDGGEPADLDGAAQLDASGGMAPSCQRWLGAVCGCLGLGSPQCAQTEQAIKSGKVATEESCAPQADFFVCAADGGVVPADAAGGGTDDSASSGCLAGEKCQSIATGTQYCFTEAALQGNPPGKAGERNGACGASTPCAPGLKCLTKSGSQDGFCAGECQPSGGAADGGTSPAPDASEPPPPQMDCPTVEKCLAGCRNGDSRCTNACVDADGPACRSCISRINTCMIINDCVDSFTGDVDDICLEQECGREWKQCFGALPGQTGGGSTGGGGSGGSGAYGVCLAACTRVGAKCPDGVTDCMAVSGSTAPSLCIPASLPSSKPAGTPGTLNGPCDANMKCQSGLACLKL